MIASWQYVSLIFVAIPTPFLNSILNSGLFTIHSIDMCNNR